MVNMASLESTVIGVGGANSLCGRWARGRRRAGGLRVNRNGARKRESRDDERAAQLYCRHGPGVAAPFLSEVHHILNLTLGIS